MCSHPALLSLVFLRVARQLRTPAGRMADERRIARDGMLYSYHAFCSYYGVHANDMWEEAGQKPASTCWRTVSIFRETQPASNSAGTPQPEQTQPASSSADAPQLGTQPALTSAGTPQSYSAGLTGTPSRQPEDVQPASTSAGAPQSGTTGMPSQQPEDIQPGVPAPEWT